MTRLSKDLPDVQAQRVDEQGRAMKGADGNVLTKTFSGQAWNLTGSNPTTNGGWEALAAEVPSEIADDQSATTRKPRKTAAAMNDDDVTDVTSKIQ